MLVLTRKAGEELHIGKDVVVTIVELSGGKVRLGIQAPRTVRVVRAELLRALEAEQLPRPTPSSSLGLD